MRDAPRVQTLLALGPWSLVLGPWSSSSSDSLPSDPLFPGCADAATYACGKVRQVRGVRFMKIVRHDPMIGDGIGRRGLDSLVRGGRVSDSLRAARLRGLTFRQRHGDQVSRSLRALRFVDPSRSEVLIACLLLCPFAACLIPISSLLFFSLLFSSLLFSSLHLSRRIRLRCALRASVPPCLRERPDVRQKNNTRRDCSRRVSCAYR